MERQIHDMLRNGSKCVGTCTLIKPQRCAAVRVTGKLLSGAFVPLFSREIMTGYNEVLRRKDSAFLNPPLSPCYMWQRNLASRPFIKEKSDSLPADHFNGGKMGVSKERTWEQ